MGVFVLCLTAICLQGFEIRVPDWVPSRNAEKTENRQHAAVEESVNTKYTQFTVIYPDDKIGTSTVSIRGSSCNMTWNKGIPLKKIQANMWATSMLCP